MQTRREALVALSSILLGSSSTFAATAAVEEPYAADPKVIAKWMDGWMPTDKDVIGTLHLGRFPERMYFLRKPIRWEPNPGQSNYSAVTVPIGFVTDFASIRRLFWSALPPDGPYIYPAILHDYLYWNQGGSKEDADSIFKFAMEDFGIGTVTIALIYNAVHLFGRSAWDENARVKASGEGRILCRYPDKPTITWEDWKKTPGVFEGCATEPK